MSGHTKRRPHGILHGYRLLKPRHGNILHWFCQLLPYICGGVENWVFYDVFWSPSQLWYTSAAPWPSFLPKLTWSAVSNHNQKTFACWLSSCRSCGRTIDIVIVVYQIVLCCGIHSVVSIWLLPNLYDLFAVKISISWKHRYLMTYKNKETISL